MAFRREPQRTRGVLVGVASIAVIVVPLGFLRDRLSLVTPALLLVLPVLLAAVLGGRAASIAVALGAALAYNLVFIPPVFTLQIHRLDDIVAYVVFTTVAIVIGTLVSRLAERRRVAEQSAAEIARVHTELVAVTAERERLATEAQRVAVLEAVDRQRSALLRGVSHDLRTPLVAIRGVSSDLRSDEVYDSATRHDLLDLVISEAERLDRIVANLLSYSRIDAGALAPHLGPVDLGESVAHAARRLGRLYARSALDVDVDPDLPLALADEALLDQVVTNLLENGVRHGGHNVRISAIAEGDDRIRVTVDDDGRGLGTVDRELLFQPWNDIGHGAHSGVGLAICRSIVEAHGGSISADDNPGGGARFSFTLPRWCGDPDEPA